MSRTYTYQNQSISFLTNRSENTFSNFSFTQGTVTFFSQPIPPPVDPETDISHYEVAIVSVTDYSPFGVQLDGRTLSVEGYRYRFQNQEVDDEVKGNGNSVNYKYRMHDPRLGRFFAVDPLSKKYPFYSPYAFSGNIVICAKEIEGMQPEWLMPWYSLTPSDISSMTAVMTPTRAELFKSTALKVKQMHDNYVAGFTDRVVVFSQEEMGLLTGSASDPSRSEDMARIGNDGAAGVASFASLKNPHGKPISDKEIKVYPIRVSGVLGPNGQSDYPGLLFGVAVPSMPSASFGGATRSLNTVLARTTTIPDAATTAIKDANSFFDNFMAYGWSDGTTGAALLSTVARVEIDYWQNSDRPEVSTAYLNAFQSQLQSRFGSSISVVLKNRDTPSVDGGNAYSATVLKNP